MFCCAGFENLIERAGQRGLSAVVLRFPLKELGFLLQARAVALEDEGVIGPNHPLPVTLRMSSSIGLQYCPFCGQRLKKFAEKSPSEFEALARKHESLRPEGLPSG